VLANKATELGPITGPPAPHGGRVYLGAEYVNSEVMSDVTFLVEGRKFFAHRIALLASSDTFKAMFDGHYREKEATTIPIPNIRFCVFEAMMHCIYTGFYLTPYTPTKNLHLLLPPLPSDTAWSIYTVVFSPIHPIQPCPSFSHPSHPIPPGASTNVFF
jgi:hypothetical protein